MCVSREVAASTNSRTLREVSSMSIYVCQICDQSTGNDIKLLSRHLYFFHKDITKEQYYQKYLKNSDNKCLFCKNPTKFINLNKGYARTCSRSCSTKYYWENSKKSEDRRKELSINMKGNTFSIGRQKQKSISKNRKCTSKI